MFRNNRNQNRCARGGSITASSMTYSIRNTTDIFRRPARHPLNLRSPFSFKSWIIDPQTKLRNAQRMPSSSAGVYVITRVFICKSIGYSRRHTWRFYTPIAANLIASENRKRFSSPIDADTPGDFFANRGDVAVLKTHMIKSPNLMGWLYWRFAAINVENRGNGYTWRMPANLIADI